MIELHPDGARVGHLFVEPMTDGTWGIHDPAPGSFWIELRATREEAVEHARTLAAAGRNGPL